MRGSCRGPRHYSLSCEDDHDSQPHAAAGSLPPPRRAGGIGTAAAAAAHDTSKSASHQELKKTSLLWHAFVSIGKTYYCSSFQSLVQTTNHSEKKNATKILVARKKKRSNIFFFPVTALHSIGRTPIICSDALSPVIDKTVFSASLGDCHSKSH